MSGDHKDWHKIINDINDKVDKFTSKYVNANDIPQNQLTTTIAPQSVTRYVEHVNNVSYSSIKNRIIKVLSIFGGTFLICFLYLFIAKPNFVIKKVKNPQTFFVENKVNYKLIMILSVVAGLVGSFLIYKFTKFFR